ncbi:MAG: SPFH/Band 7/PHB domain protein [Bacilli bacterium]|nr:SPFH/Band 7/PHB domain protein [Bacilli bacterium]
MNRLVILASDGLPVGAILAIVFGVIAFIVLAILIGNIKIVKQTEEYIIERLGKYRKTWTTGFHVLIPFAERIASKVSKKEQIGDFLPQAVITKDNVTMQIDTVVFYYVTDSKLFTYGVTDPTSALEKLTATTLRNIIGELDLDTTLTSRDTINAKMKEILDDATDPWGIKVTRVEVKNILPPKDIREAMERQMRAEREKREKILLAEGQKQSEILIAEGQKESAILTAEAEKVSAIKRAEGQAESILKIKQAEADAIRLINEAQPSKQVLQLESLKTLEKVADGKATKIIVPSEIQNLASLKDIINSDK